jgi:hypothetical protein
VIRELDIPAARGGLAGAISKVRGVRDRHGAQNEMQSRSQHLFAWPPA